MRSAALALFLGACVFPAAPILSAQTSAPDMHMVLTGDSIIHRRLSVLDDPASLKLFGTIRGADVAFTNFETLVLPSPNAFPGASENGGAYQASPAWAPEELKWAGFNMVSSANNHAFDFGVAGMRSTIEALDKAGLVHAGTGENLAIARAPAYLDTKRGLVALISCTSTYTTESPASEQRPDFMGRPGVDPLRFTATYTVDPKLFESIQTVGGMLNEASDGQPPEGNKAAKSGVRLGGVLFRPGSPTGLHTQADKRDLDGIVASVRNAHRQSDWVIVTSHTHESGPGGRNIPPEFLVATAHAAIDAGADVFVGHGPHVLRGIEIYKGKPIFYSLGDFILENEEMVSQPSDSYDQFRLPDSATIADFLDARSANDTRGFPVDRDVWESVVAQVSFRADHTLHKIVLTPISLGYMKPRADRGRPRLSDPEQARKMIDLVTRLSAALGTRVVYEDGRGVICETQCSEQ